MLLRTARPSTETGSVSLGTRATATRGPRPVSEQPPLHRSQPPFASVPRSSLLALQRTAGNAAVAADVAARRGTPVVRVQRTTSNASGACLCDTEDASAEGELGTPTAQRQTTDADAGAGVAAVQRDRAAGPPALVVQRTTVGPILDEYFSPFSSPRVWIMEETDPYTVLVRGWQPVIDGQAWLLTHLELNTADWAARHRTTPGWRPGMTGHDPAAASNSVPSPPGTDPVTCRNAFLPYLAGEAARRTPLPIPGVPPFPRELLPRIETWELHTCAIGSFVLRATLDAIDEPAGTATVNIWMQNEMSRASFGRFADKAVLSGQATQYMWWHWRVQHRWVPAPPPPPPPPTPVPPLPLSGDLLFDFDSAVVRPEARSALVATLPSLRVNPSTNVVGHTDSVGTDEYNQGLSERRARAVIATLVAEDHSLAGRLHAVGRGESQRSTPKTRRKAAGGTVGSSCSRRPDLRTSREPSGLRR